jgi:hypothetical protein
MLESLVTAPLALIQEEGGADPAESTTGESVSEPAEGGNFFVDDWGALLMGLLGFVDMVARLTPTEKDNSIVNFLMMLFNAKIPNLKKGGAVFSC